MAADPFAFYRGSAPLYYADVVRLEDPWADERTSRVWIQGDLHAENYGTYMDASGQLVFDVNDFDEAYVGHFTWDLRRMAASLALLGFAKALSDDAIRDCIESYGRAYVEQVRAFVENENDGEFRLTLDNTSGVVEQVLHEARQSTRIQLLENLTTIAGNDRVFVDGPACGASTTTSAPRSRPPTRPTSTRSPRSSASAASRTRSRTSSGAAGSGSAAPACPRTTCSSRVARRRSRTTSCCR
jgi:uncharacterized protein (DUF2252 family)